MSAFTAIGAARPEYDWRRYRVSSLAIGRQGWLQRANFVLVGVLYLCAAGGIRPSSRRKVGPRAVPALVAGAGLGLIGSGLFVTDPVGGFPSGTNAQEGSADCNVAEGTPTREGRLHNLSARFESALRERGVGITDRGTAPVIRPKISNDPR